MPSSFVPDPKQLSLAERLALSKIKAVLAFVRHDSRHCRVQGGQRFHVALDFLFLLAARLARSGQS
jgi:hypothetical protein